MAATKMATGGGRWQAGVMYKKARNVGECLDGEKGGKSKAV